MAKDFIYKIKQGDALPAADPNGYRVLLDENTGLFKLLASDGSVIEAPGASSSDSSTTTVDVSAAQILDTGSNDIELLPNLGAGEYYSNFNVILEYTHNGTPYTLGDNMFIYCGDNLGIFLTSTMFTNPSDSLITFNRESFTSYVDGSVFMKPQVSLDTNISGGLFLTTNSVAPTLGNGTIKAKITYTVSAFG